MDTTYKSHAMNTSHQETFTPKSEKPSTKNPILDQLLFLSRYYGRSISATQLQGNLPLTDHQTALQYLDEIAAQAGLTLEPLEVSNKLKATVFPVMVFDHEEEPLIILGRDGDRLELRSPFASGSTWISESTFFDSRTYTSIYTVRPVFYFDERSLLYQTPKPRRWFWDTLNNNRWIYGWALLATVLINLFAAVIPFFTMAVYDRVVPNNAIDSLRVLAIAAITIIAFDLLIKNIRSYLIDTAARKTDISLSSQIFSKALQMRAAYRPASGGVLANIVRDFESIREFFTSTTLTLLGDLPFMLFFLSIIWLVGGNLVLVPLTLIPLSLGVSWLLRRPLSRVMEQNTQESSQRTAHLFESMNGLDTIKCLGLEAWSRRKWETLTVSLSNNTARMRKLSGFGASVSGAMTSLNTVLLVSIGALFIAAGDMTMGQLIAVSMLSSRAIAPAAQLSSLIVRWQQTSLSLHALNQIMAAPTDDHTGERLFLPKINGQIDFKDLKFSYPDSVPTLRGINLSISPGERVAFIGKIGSGKSTLLKLLLNLFEPTEGVALIDGIATTQIDASSLRRGIGYVPQDVTLFHGDIRENILAGTPHASDEDILEAIRLSCLEESLANMPAGLGTPVGERGERLSGGQRQAVAIARAWVRKPKILLVDEPSSMMDPATEQRLLNNLQQSLGDTTLLLVTHRMAMLPLVDRLVVFSQGRVVIDGPREQVLKHLGGQIENNTLKQAMAQSNSVESPKHTAPTQARPSQSPKHREPVRGPAKSGTKTDSPRPPLKPEKQMLTPEIIPGFAPQNHHNPVQSPANHSKQYTQRVSHTSQKKSDTRTDRQKRLLAVHAKAKRILAEKAAKQATKRSKSAPNTPHQQTKKGINQPETA